MALDPRHRVVALGGVRGYVWSGMLRAHARVRAAHTRTHEASCMLVVVVLIVQQIGLSSSCTLNVPGSLLPTVQSSAEMRTKQNSGIIKAQMWASCGSKTYRNLFPTLTTRFL